MLLKKIPGYEGLYSATSTGLIYSHVSREYMKPQLLHNGYLKVRLSKNGIVKNERVHRLVAAAFHGRPLPGLVTNHKDGTRDNNYASNLEWVTTAENNLDMHRRKRERLTQESDHNTIVANV